MCSGRVDLEFILRALHNGMDGVFIGGCKLHECNYVTHGNYHALTTVLLAKKVMEFMGVNPDRLRVEFMSAADGLRFAEVVDDFTKQVRELGPLGSSEGLGLEELRGRIAEVNKLVPYLKVRTNDKLNQRLTSPAAYPDFFQKEEVEALLTNPAAYYIDPQKCQACGICARRCPVEAISGAKKQVHVIDQDQCIRCGTCYEACPSRFGAVQLIQGAPVPPPPEPGQAIVSPS